MIQVRPATLQDARFVGARLRVEDEREVNTATGRPGTEVVPLALHASSERYTVWHAGTPVALAGVVPRTDGLGSVWMLCTDGVRFCALSLVSESRYWLDHMARAFPNGLTARADARNTAHLRWCKLMGFRELASEVVNGHRFIRIHKESRTNV